MRNKYYLIDLFKFLFSLMIAVFHFWGIYKQPARGGFIGVEFYFMVSGFFLMMKYKETAGHLSAWQYTINRLKKLYPHYIFSFVAIFILKNIIRGNGLSKIIHNFVNQWFEIFLLNGSFIVDEKTYIYNSVTWYMSVMIVVGYAVWELVRKYETTLLTWSPIVIIWIYVYIIYNLGTTNNWRIHVAGILNYGILRGVAGILLGICIYHISQRSQTHCLKCIRRGGGVGILLIATVFVGSYFRWNRICFCYVFLLAAGLVFIADDTNQYKPAETVMAAIRYCAKISYAVYLNHFFVEHIMKNYLFPEYHVWLIPIYIIFVCLYSVLTTWLVEKGTKRISGAWHDYVAKRSCAT